jgi:hypothetical protein
LTCDFWAKFEEKSFAARFCGQMRILVEKRISPLRCLQKREPRSNDGEIMAGWLVIGVGWDGEGQCQAEGRCDVDDDGDDEEELQHEDGGGDFAEEEEADHWSNGAGYGRRETGQLP